MDHEPTSSPAQGPTANTPDAPDPSSDDQSEPSAPSGDSPASANEPRTANKQAIDNQPAGEQASDNQTVAEDTQEGIQAGAIHQGKVTRITTEFVSVKISDDVEGTIPLIEFTGQPIPVVGDTLQVMVDEHDPETGRVILSKRGADEYTFWQAVKPGDILEGVVTGMNKGGLDVDLGGARAFLPASQVDTKKLKDISMMIGEHVRCAVTQVDPATHDLIVSRRKLLAKQRKEQRQQALEALQEGQVVTGKVTGLADYGAFLDVGHVSGLLHINDMSWSHVTHPSQVVEEGQELSVKLLKVNLETGKITLGLKQTAPDPWENIDEKYPLGKQISCKVLRVADFGAFVELEPGIEALLPMSEMAWGRRPHKATEVVNIGDTLDVKIINVDKEKRQISVSLRQTQENPWDKIEEKYPLESKVTGKVSKIVDYGAFVELEPGMEGLIHISELSDQRVKSVGDVVQQGQEIEVRVIKLDKQEQRISLSTRTPQKRDRSPDKSAKTKRKRPLRGGLASHFEW